MPELLNEVAGRLVSVEEGLAAIDDHKRILLNNTGKVKTTISNAMERQMKILKNREKQLIRQVEVASTHQQSELNMTQAVLLQHKGALSVTRSLLDTCDTDALRPNTHLASELVSTVNCLPHEDAAGLLDHTQKLIQVPLVSFSMDESTLSQNVSQFGRINLPPPCSTLPHCPIEEYGDADHHVLHKSVRPGRVPVLDVRKPYILAARAGLNQPTKTTKKFVNNKVGGDDKDLLKWLHKMHLDDDKQSEIAQRSSPVLDVEDACQANAPCSSFSECIMDGRCMESARQKLEQCARWQATHHSSSISIQDEMEHDKECNEAARNILEHLRSITKTDNSEWVGTRSSSTMLWDDETYGQSTNDQSYDHNSNWNDHNSQPETKALWDDGCYKKQDLTSMTMDELPPSHDLVEEDLAVVDDILGVFKNIKNSGQEKWLVSADDLKGSNGINWEQDGVNWSQDGSNEVKWDEDGSKFEQKWVWNPEDEKKINKEEDDYSFKMKNLEDNETVFSFNKLSESELSDSWILSPKKFENDWNSNSSSTSSFTILGSDLVSNQWVIPNNVC